MQPTSAGQNVILTGYISYSGPGAALGTLTEDTAARVPGLAERFSGICNSVADFFMSAKGKVNNSLHQLGDRIKNISFRCEKTEIQAETPHPPMQIPSFSQILLESAKECLPKHLDTLAGKLENNEPLQPDMLVSISGGSLRGVITQLSSINGKIYEPGSEGIREESGNLLRKEVAQGEFSQLGSIADLGKAKEYLARPGFEAIFRESVGQVISEIRGKILPELMKL